MIRFISAEETFPLRNEVLRNGLLKPEECRFDGDDAEGAVHVGYFDEELLVCVVSFHPVNREGFGEGGYQLRGMATREGYRGKGIGNLVVNFGVLFLKGQKVSYVWCNARAIAYSFYLGQGFEFISEIFEIKEIGPHRTMYLKL